MKNLLFEKINSLDVRLLLIIQIWRRKSLNHFFKVITYSGTGKAWFTLAIVLNVLNYKGIHFTTNQQTFMNALFSPLLAWVFSSMFKKLVSRPRPSSCIVGYKKIISDPGCNSFPSSHTASSFSFFVALSSFQHPWAAYIGIWAGLVSFSRIYLGVHYLTDVLGGILLGCLSAFLISNF